MTAGSKDAQRLAPNSQESEEAVLGSILINPDCLHDVKDWLTPECFYFLNNRYVYQAMLAMVADNDEIDPLTLTERLREYTDRDGQTYLDKCGGASFVTYLINSTPTHVHVDTYARMVERLAVRRRMLDAASQIAKLALSDNDSIEDIAFKAQDAIQDAMGTRPDEHLLTLRQAAALHMTMMSERYENQDELPGFPTGFRQLDHVLNGMKKARLTVLAARPGLGKTSLALNIALNVARARKGVLIFSLEMKQDELMDRLFAIETGIPGKKLEGGKLTPDEYDRYIEATSRIEGLPIYIDDSTNPTLGYIRGKAQRLQHEYGLGLVIVDYIGLMQTGKGETRNLEIAEISRGLKNMSKELDVHVMALSQLNRGVEGRQEKKPMLSDLRDSGALEQDANHVLFIWHEGDMTKPMLTVAKNRSGELADIPMAFNGMLTKFTERGR